MLFVKFSLEWVYSVIRPVKLFLRSSHCASPLSETNDVDPELISCIRPLRLPRSLAVCCLASAVITKIGTNKSQVYSFTGAALTPRRQRPHLNNKTLFSLLPPNTQHWEELDPVCLYLSTVTLTLTEAFILIIYMLPSRQVCLCLRAE